MSRRAVEDALRTGAANKCKQCQTACSQIGWELTETSRYARIAARNPTARNQAMVGKAKAELTRKIELGAEHLRNEHGIEVRVA